MRFFFDTSVLVAASEDNHVHHEASLPLIRKATVKDSCCAAHTLAEAFSTLTRMPGHYQARPEEAMLLLESLQERLSIITLEASEYWSTIKSCSELGIVGGAVYDALIARCAIKARVEILYTWNVMDFRRFGTEIANRVRTP